MTDRPRPRRSRRRRVLRALLFGALALGLLYAWDGARQPVSGDGWRILAAQRGLGEPGSVSLVADPIALADAWDRLRMLGPVPEVDFERWLGAWFVDTGTFACRSRLDGIVFDPGRRLVAGAFGRGLVLGCDDGAVADSFLVLLERRRLPPPPFVLQLRDPLPSDAPAGRVEVVAAP